MISPMLERLYKLMLDGADVVESTKIGNIYLFNITIPRHKDSLEALIGLNYQTTRYGKWGTSMKIILGPDTKEFYKWIYDNKCNMKV